MNVIDQFINRLTIYMIVGVAIMIITYIIVV